MVIEEGQKVKATCLNGAVYVGIIYKICLGLDKEKPTEASIFISKEKSDDMKYGHAQLWCCELKNIEAL